MLQHLILWLNYQGGAEREKEWSYSTFLNIYSAEVVSNSAEVPALTKEGVPSFNTADSFSFTVTVNGAFLLLQCSYFASSKSEFLMRVLLRTLLN